MKNEKRNIAAVGYELSGEQLERVSGGAYVKFPFDEIKSLLNKCMRELEDAYPSSVKIIKQCIHDCESKASLMFKSDYNTLKSKYPNCSVYPQIDALIPEA